MGQMLLLGGAPKVTAQGQKSLLSVLICTWTSRPITLSKFICYIIAQMHEKRKPFQGKVAFVSGGSRGIGLAIAEKLAQRGAAVVFTYLRSRGDAAKAEEKLSAHRVKVLPIRANMGNVDQVAKIFDAIRSEF